MGGKDAEDGTDAGCACEMHGAVACNCRVECEMSGHDNWWVRSTKMPSLGNSACAKIGSRAEASVARPALSSTERCIYSETKDTPEMRTPL